MKPLTKPQVSLICIGILTIAAALWILNLGTDTTKGEGSQVSPPAPTLNGELTVSSAVVSPGERFSVTVTDQRVVGVDFSLSVWDGKEWNYEYQLFSSRRPVKDDATPWMPWEDRLITSDEGIGGKNPIYFAVPDDIELGEYRLCAEKSQPPACSALTVKS